MSRNPLRSRRALLILAGLLIVFVAGGASVARWGRLPSQPPAVVPAPEPEPARTPPRVPDSALPPAPAPPPDALSRSALPLQLLATLVGATRDLSLAFVREIPETGAAATHPYGLREGQHLHRYPEVMLASIETDRVLLERDGRLEWLPLDPEAAAAFEREAGPLPPPSAEEARRRREIAERVRQRIEAPPDELPPGFVGGLLAEGEPYPIYVDGALVGIELQNVRPDGLYARLGLRDGDLIESINGVAFDAPEAGGEWVRQLGTSPQIELSVERSDGTRQRVSIPRAELLEQLQALE